MNIAFCIQQQCQGRRKLSGYPFNPVIASKFAMLSAVRVAIIPGTNGEIATVDSVTLISLAMTNHLLSTI